MIEARDLTKRFTVVDDGGAVRVRTALCKVSLSITPGEIVGILGPTGCGKTTLLELLAGMQAPTEGSVRINGVLALPPEPFAPRALRAYRQRHLLPSVSNGLWRDRRRHDVAVVFQDHAVFPWMTTLRNVTFALRAGGVPRAQRRERAVAALESVGLADALYKYPTQLSVGMRQRLALARAFVVQPKVIFLDEPFASVDQATRRQLQDLLLDIWEATGATIVIVTHDHDEAVYLCDRIVLFEGAPGVVSRIHPVRRDRPRTRAVLETIQLPKLGNAESQLSSTPIPRLLFRGL